MAFSLSDTKVLLQGRKKHIVWDEMNEKYYQENESMITKVPTIRPTIPIILALSIFFFTPTNSESFQEDCLLCFITWWWWRELHSGSQGHGGEATQTKAGLWAKRPERASQALEEVTHKHTPKKQKRTAHRVYKSKKYMLFASSTVHRIAAENVICNDNHSVSDSEIEWGKIKKEGITS